MADNILIPTSQMKATFYHVLVSLGFTHGKADKCAEIFTLNSLEGIYTHGVNRFPRFVANVRDGYVHPDAEPSLVNRFGSMEQWDGKLGPGPLNAVFSTDQAMNIADEGGIGMVAIGNTNHWMRGGTYGWQAAKKGYVFIGWTNTIANMPAWGAVDPRLGNNPFVIAVPYKTEAIVLDMAMSQYSYGKMELYQQDGRDLPVYGGYNKHGKLTKNPGEIIESGRALPIGYWKGAGFSFLLDVLGTILSGGLSTHELSKTKVEYSVSQVFIAIKLEKLNNFPFIETALEKIIADYKQSFPADDSVEIRYPGENIVKTRNINLQRGIPVNKDIWETILRL